MQKTALPLVACLLAFAVAGAHAQTLWKWRDASGQLHIGDTPPPPGTPAKDVVSGPSGGLAPRLVAASAAANPASGAASAGETALDKKKKAADQEKADKQKADREALAAKNAATRKDNCTRAQSSVANLQSGMRIARVSANGEREFIDDAARASELKQAQDAVAANCGPAPNAQ